MSQKEAALVSLPEFNQRREGWERERRNRWEMARWMMWQEYLLNPYIKPANKPRSPYDILRLEGDPEPKALTKEECHIGDEEKTILCEIFNKLKKHNG